MEKMLFFVLNYNYLICAMPNINTSSFHSRILLQRVDERPVQDENFSEYIEFPLNSIHFYLDLEAHPLYPQIKQQFLDDINQLKIMANFYFEDKYNFAINIFHHKIRNPESSIRDSLLPLFRETRFQIHRLVRKLNKYQALQGEASSSHAQSFMNKDQIASLLDECLTGIDLCAAGVHGRFAYSILVLDAAEAGLSGRIFNIKKQLFDDFIKWFLFDITQKKLLNITVGMEIHWFNAFHNIYCESLGLSLITDSFATTHLDSELMQSFLSAAPFYISAHSIILTMAEQWSETFSTTLEEQGVPRWKNENIAFDEMKQEKLETLENTVFKPLNLLFEMNDERSICLSTLLESNFDEGVCHLARYKEKMLAWITQSLLNAKPTVFSSVSLLPRNTFLIGTMDHLFFWVFKSINDTPMGSVCDFDPDNHISLQLQHIQNIQFSSWPSPVSFALLRQALIQTEDAKEAYTFFFDDFIKSELARLDTVSTHLLSMILNEKTIRNSVFKDDLLTFICAHIKDKHPYTAIQLQFFPCLIKKAMFDSVLCALKENSLNIQEITATLTLFEISAFPIENINKILSHQDFKRLFEEAINLKDSKAMAYLILTGSCDEYATKLNEQKENLLHIFAQFGFKNALVYLLNNVKTLNVNAKNTTGYTPLHYAALEGQSGCLYELCRAKNIVVNRKNNVYESTPLHLAAIRGNLECLKILLQTAHIDVNEKAKCGWTPIHYAIYPIHIECLEVLLETKGILVNTKIYDGTTALHVAAKKGRLIHLKKLIANEHILINEINLMEWTPLHFCAIYGHTDCMRALLEHEDIEVNIRGKKGWTPLHYAAKNGHLGCVKALLERENIKINAKTTIRRYTPLNLAIKKGHLECAEALESHKASTKPSFRT